MKPGKRKVLHLVPTFLLAIVATAACCVDAAMRCSPTALVNGDFESGDMGLLVQGWTQVDIKSPGDHASMGLRSSSSVVLTIDGERYLNAGRSSVFYQQVSGAAVVGAVFNASALVTSAGSSYGLSRFYFTTGTGQSASLGVTPSTAGGAAPLASMTSSAKSGARAAWTTATASFVASAADAGKPVFINIESHRDVTTALVAFDRVVVTECGSGSAPTTTTSKRPITTTTTAPSTTTTAAANGCFKVFTDADSFFSQAVAAPFGNNTFGQASGASGASASFDVAGLCTCVVSEPGTYDSSKVYANGDYISTLTMGNTLTVEFTSCNSNSNGAGCVRAFGAHFFNTDFGDGFSASPVTIALSSGAVVTFMPPNRESSFRGFLLDRPISSFAVYVARNSTGASVARAFPSLDNLTVSAGTSLLPPTC